MIPSRRKAKALLWMSVGAALAYFCDPELGRSRRERAKDRVRPPSGDVQNDPSRAGHSGRAHP